MNKNHATYNFRITVEEFDTKQWALNVLTGLLKPCPICGSNELAIHAPNSNKKEDVTCLNCGLKMEKALGNDTSCIEWWNTRPE